MKQFFLLSSKSSKKRLILPVLILRRSFWHFFRHEKLEFSAWKRLHLALGQIDLVKQLWPNKSRRGQQALWWTKGKESRARGITLVAEMQLTAATDQARLEERCTISHQTNLYGRSRFSSSEFKGKISSQANLRLVFCILWWQLLPRQGTPLVRWLWKNKYAQAVLDSWISSFKRILLSLILLLWLHDFHLYYCECLKNRCLGMGYICK